MKKLEGIKTERGNLADPGTGCQKYILCDVEGHNERDESV